MTRQGSGLWWHRGAAPVAVAAGVALAAGGCVSLPTSSSPQVVDTFAPASTQASLPSPVPGQEPDLLVRDFLKASSLADQRHAAARQFLSPKTAESWDDSPAMTIVLRADLTPAGPRSADHATYTLRGQKVGTLDPGGIYREEAGAFEAEVELTRVDGQWRIDRLPSGVVLERTEFFSAYSQRSLYFLPAEGDQLVADPRWTTARRTDLGFSLVNLLATGPRPELAPGVDTRVPAAVSVRPGDAQGSSASDGTTVDFQGLSVFNSQKTTQFAAQVVWTLASAQVAGPYRIERDGSPIDERHAGGWTTDDVKAFSPAPPPTSLGTALTAADGLVRVDGAGAHQAGGPWSELRGGRAGALSRDGRVVAVTTGPAAGGAGPAALYVGPVDGRPERVPVEAGSLTTPTFHPGRGTVWTVADGTRLVTVGSGGGRRNAEEPDPGPLGSLGGPVTDLRFDPTGSRVAAVSRGRVFVGTVDRRDGRLVRGSFQQIGRSLGESATSVAWRDSSTVVVGRSAAEAPVVTLTVDGALTEPQSQRNITAPVDAVASAGADILAVDRRSLLRSDVTAETGDRYWREVPGLAAIRAFPVVPG